MTVTVRVEDKGWVEDHARCLECNRPLKNPKWRKIGRGKKCYAKHCKALLQEEREPLGLPQTSVAENLVPPADADSYVSSSPMIVEPTKKQLENQERAPDPTINKSGKRAALDAALQEEMAKVNPEPTAEQLRAAKQRLLTDVDKALELEEGDGGRGDSAGHPGQTGPAEETGEMEQKKKRTKAPKGQVIVRPGAFNRSGRSMVVNGRNKGD